MLAASGPSGLLTAVSSPERCPWRAATHISRRVVPPKRRRKFIPHRQQTGQRRRHYKAPKFAVYSLLEGLVGLCGLYGQPLRAKRSPFMIRTASLTTDGPLCGAGPARCCRPSIPLGDGYFRHRTTSSFTASIGTFSQPSIGPSSGFNGSWFPTCGTTGNPAWFGPPIRYAPGAGP
jgi:hypothetical protein